MYALIASQEPAASLRNRPPGIGASSLEGSCPLFAMAAPQGPDVARIAVDGRAKADALSPFLRLSRSNLTNGNRACQGRHTDLFREPPCAGRRALSPRHGVAAGRASRDR